MRKALRLALVVLAVASSARADGFACLRQRQVGEMERLFHFQSGNSSITNADFDGCDPANLQTKVLSALVFLERHARPPSLVPAFGPEIIGPNAWSFFRGRIGTIDYRGENDEGCSDGSGSFTSTSAYVDKRGSRTMFICPAVAELEVWDLAAVLMHEARHNEGYWHVDCTHGFFGGEKDEGSCDASYAEGGAYAVGVEYALRIARDPHVDPILRNSARVGGLNDLAIRFNAWPKQSLRQKTILQAEGGGLFAFEKGSLEALKAEGGVLVNYGGFPVLFGEHSVRQMSAKGAADFTSDMIQFYLEKVPRSMRRSLVDVFYGNAFSPYACFLSSRQLLCRSNDAKAEPVRISLERIRPVGFFARTARSRQLISVVDEFGRRYPLPASFAELAKTTEADLLPTAEEGEILRVAPAALGADAGEYAIDVRGRLLYSQRGAAWYPVPAAAGRTWRALSGPIYDERDVR